MKQLTLTGDNEESTGSKAGNEAEATFSGEMGSALDTEPRLAEGVSIFSDVEPRGVEDRVRAAIACSSGSLMTTTDRRLL